jgi:hypothetical protein
MKSTRAKQIDEYGTFSAALKKILTVSRAELAKRMEAEATEKKKRKITRASVGRASDVKD